ncbi:serine hydrolase, partial [Komagataeibacter melomenusus]|nr:serine hydrolase [Komagataeibacter melomenusus]
MHASPVARHPRRRHVLTLGGAAILTACARTGRGQQMKTGMADVDRLLRQAVATHATPGVVCAIGHGQQVVHRAVYGQRAVVPT